MKARGRRGHRTHAHEDLTARRGAGFSAQRGAGEGIAGADTRT